MTRILLQWMLLIVALFAPLATPRSAAAESKAEFQQFVDFLKTPANLKASDISKLLRENLAKKKKEFAAKSSYDALRSYYRKNLLALGAQFPAGTIDFNFDAFSKYDGTLRLGGEDAFYVPFIPISTFAEISVESMSFHKLRIDYQGKTISGLRVSGMLDPALKDFISTKDGKRSFLLPYLTSINARAMGFRSGQLIPELTANIEPCFMFMYNGLHDWREHNRYSRDDQIKQPISLTNFAHAAGTDFNVSDHPDFSVMLNNLSVPARMTFFLWKSKGKSGKFDILPRALHLPDFVFEYEIRP